MKKKKQEHENLERWLVSYADFITLLFAFFVVMFAISQVDAQKLGRFQRSVNVAFEYTGPFPESSSTPIPNDVTPEPPSRPAIAPGRISVAGDGALNRRAREIREAIGRKLAGSVLQGKVRVHAERRGVAVSLLETGFFDPGSAQVRPEAFPTLREIARILGAQKCPLAVEGHTDNTPIKTALFPSNWELSTARATRIVTWLIEETHYEPSLLSAAGCGEYRPVADNATPAGRALNRRVDLIVLTDGSSGPPPS